jgi:hypothetical protein
LVIKKIADAAPTTAAVPPTILSSMKMANIGAKSPVAPIKRKSDKTKYLMTGFTPARK